MGLKVPHEGGVRIDERKVRDHLLSKSHPVGRFKARLFAAVGEVSETVETPFGQKYVVPGDLNGPLGSVPVLTVWFLELGQERARLVTVRPG